MSIDKTSNIEAERGFLASVGVDNNKLVEAIANKVTEEWFSEPLHQMIWKSAVKNQDDECIDIAVMTDLNDQWNEVQEVFASVDTSVGFRTFLRELKETYKKKQIRKMTLKTLDDLNDGVDSSVILSETDKELTKLAQEQMSSVRTGTEVLASAEKNLIERQNLGDGLQGIPSGIRKLDMYTKGFKKGNNVVAARTGMGKTAFAVECAVSCLRENKKLYFVNLEMEAEDLITRMQCNIADVAVFPIEDNTASEGQKKRWQESINFLDKSKREETLWFDDEAGLTFSQIRARARKLARKGLDMMIVDYVQIINSEAGKEDETNYNRVSYASRQFKVLSKELGIPIILLGQLARRADEDGRRPKLSDLKESGGLEQDADLVLFIWKKETTSNNVILSIGKQRNGPTNKDIDLVFDGAKSSFRPPTTLC
jgi:replicative DNA helicase